MVFALVLGTYVIRRRAMERINRDETTLSAGDVNGEARGYGPYLAAFSQKAEVDGSEVTREHQADSREIFEAPGDLPKFRPSQRGKSLLHNNV